MKSLEQLKNEILADGIIDASEVKEIREVIYADGKIDQEEADFLFDLNDAVSGKNNDPSWKELFVKAIASFVLEDDKSAVAVYAEKIAYLAGQIQGDGQVDAVERALLTHLKSTLGKLPNELEALLSS